MTNFLRTFNFLQRIACHIQIFALSRWLAVTLPVEYLELTRGLQWSIPYSSLPWEIGRIQPVTVGPSPATSSHSFIPNIHDSVYNQRSPPDGDNLNKAVSIYGLPLTPMEYRMYFEVRILLSRIFTFGIICFCRHFANDRTCYIASE